MFSPYYKWARRRGPTDPRRHVAMNVVLYGRDRKRWALTERGAGALRVTPTLLEIGPSAMRLSPGEVCVSFDERTMPIPGRLAGEVRLTMSGVTPGPHALDADGRHLWWPIAPASRASVALTHPKLSFSGAAYFDTNEGSRPLEADFDHWNWSRAPIGDGAAVLYDVVRADGSRKLIALDIAGDGSVAPLPEPPEAPLPKGPLWRMDRLTRSEDPSAVRVLRTYEDTPFYTRSKIATRLKGVATSAMHESLSMPRFVHPLTQLALPFRMPRRPS